MPIRRPDRKLSPELTAPPVMGAGSARAAGDGPLGQTVADVPVSGAVIGEEALTPAAAGSRQRCGNHSDGGLDNGAAPQHAT